jgi:hypothetical protein
MPGLKLLMLEILQARGAEYPAEHNVGHLYQAKPQLAAFYRCNPDGTRDRRSGRSRDDGWARLLSPQAGFRTSPDHAHALKAQMLEILQARGAEYPAEHNVGHLYQAKPQMC